MSNAVRGRGRGASSRNTRAAAAMSNSVPSTSQATAATTFSLPPQMDADLFWSTIRNLANVAPVNDIGQGAGNRDEEVNTSADRSDLTNRTTIRDSVKVDYKLTAETRFELWLDLFRSELRHHRLLDIIDPHVRPMVPFSVSEMEQRRAEVRYILVNRLDEVHHSMVIACDDPTAALETLKSHRFAELNIGSAALRKRVQDFKFIPKKCSFSQYLAKLETLIREYERCSPKLSEREKCEILMNNVAGCYPELDTVVISRNACDKYGELKIIILQLEARRNDKKELNLNSSVVNQPNTNPRITGTVLKTGGIVKRNLPHKKPTCFKCGAPGHTIHQCLVPKGSSIRWCDWCKGLVADHRSADCANKPCEPDVAVEQPPKVTRPKLKRAGQSNKKTNWKGLNKNFSNAYKPRTGIKKSQNSINKTQD